MGCVDEQSINSDPRAKPKPAKTKAKPRANP